MSKKVIITGLIGSLLLIVWTIIANSILGFKSNLDMNGIPDEQEVYEVLKENITEPGRYICNPEIIPGEAFPGKEPVFSVLYSGMGHDAAGGLMWIGLIRFILSSIIAVWLLSLSSDRILSSYPKKVFFFTLLGLFIAFFSDFEMYEIGGYPLFDMVVMAIHNVLLWTTVGLFAAWRIKPVPVK